MGWHQAGELDLRVQDGEAVARATVSSPLRLWTDDEGIHASLAGAMRTWPVARIRAFRTVRNEARIPAQWTLRVIDDLNDGEDIITSYDEGAALRLLESLARRFGVRLEEHTGRSVEADEHDMGVLDQVRTFPGRWDRPPRLESMGVRAEQDADSVTFQLPSDLGGAGQLTLWGSVVVTLLIWLLLISNLPPLLGNWDALVVFVALLPFWAGVLVLLNRPRGVLETRHRVVIEKEAVHVRPRMAGMWPLSTRTFSIDEFRDLDAIQDAHDVERAVEFPRTRLTFLFGERRVLASLPRREAEWVVGEVASQIERLHGLAGAGAVPPPRDEEV